jgi:hypothetical protein
VFIVQLKAILHRAASGYIGRPKFLKEVLSVLEMHVNLVGLTISACPAENKLKNMHVIK